MERWRGRRRKVVGRRRRLTDRNGLFPSELEESGLAKQRIWLSLSEKRKLDVF